MSDTEAPIDVKPKVKKMKKIKVKKVKKVDPEEPVEVPVEQVDAPVEVEKPKKVIKKKKVKPEEPVEVPAEEPADVPEEQEKPKKASKKKKAKPVEVPVEEVEQVQPENGVVDIEGLDNVEIDADIESLVHEAPDLNDVPDVVENNPVVPVVDVQPVPVDAEEQPGVKSDLTIIEEEYVEIIKNITDMSKALRATTTQLNKLYKKTLKSLQKVERKKVAPSEKPNELVVLEQPKTASKQFEKFCGKNSVSKIEAMKCVHKYILDHHLQSTDEKRLVTCDDVLKQLFNKDTFTYFDVSVLVDEHLK